MPEAAWVVVVVMNKRRGHIIDNGVCGWLKGGKMSCNINTVSLRLGKIKMTNLTRKWGTTARCCLLPSVLGLAPRLPDWRASGARI